MRTSLSKVARYFFLVVSVLGIALVIDDLYIVLRPQEPLGEASNNCIKGDLPSVPNGTGMVATAHVTSCSFGLAHGAETTYVYLHGLERKIAGNLLYSGLPTPVIYIVRKWYGATTQHFTFRFLK